MNTDSSTENTTTKTTTVTANYSENVYSNYQLSANTITNIALNDHTVGTASNYVQHVGVDYTLNVTNNQKITVGNNYNLNVKSKINIEAQEIQEKIASIRRSVAGVQQQILAPSIWLGSGEINISQLMLDTLDLVERLAELTANHTHPNTSTPTNATAINSVKLDAIKLDEKYSPIIAK